MLFALERRYGLAVLGLCLIGAAISTAADDDEGRWMLAATVAATVVIVLIPDGLRSVRQLRSSPHVRWFWFLLLAVAAIAGATDVTPQLLAGVVGCAAAGYATALATAHYLHSRGRR